MEKKVYQWLAYDVWADGEGGWQVNDVCPCGIFIEEYDQQDKDVWKRAVRKTLLRQGSRARLTLEWLDETMLEVFHRDEPLGRFELKNAEDYEDGYGRWMDTVSFSSPATVYSLKNGKARRIEQ